MSTKKPPQTFEEQRAAVRHAVDARGYEMAPAPDPEQARAALDALLDGRPQLAALALKLVTAVVDSGTVVTDGRPMSSVEVVRRLRRDRRAQTLAERTATIEAEFPVELHPAAFALTKLADTRKAGEKAIEVTPGMIRRAKAQGMKPADIARLLKVTDSHVYAVLRKAPDEDTAPVEDFLAQFTGLMAQADHESYEARRAHVPAGHTLYNWRLELFDGPEGDGWQSYQEGDAADVPGSETNLALAVLADAEEDDQEVSQHRARVLVWEGPEGDENDADHVHEREPAALPEPEFPVDEYRISTRSDDQQ
ncbi:hypothetical protein [Streptomyces sp. MBT53]|uniref:hypothetical protein n=1 Tax=Streptomyces sp. MBT53 TaxID=1488384 RepID=UPI0019134E9A|nr:hypothetical protein [Streptomyces sp. MBT53]MBK6015607.1 hypothetical protein [Streptomyces sp. MBT53]